MRWLWVFISILVTGIVIFYFRSSYPFAKFYTYENQAFKHEFVIAQAHTLTGFNLLDPEQAPLEIRDSVMRGYHLMMNTALHAPDYAFDQLSCTNCHFAEGDTLGGKNGSISLVGVTTTYPQYSPRSKKVISLEQRINNCFERSLNGRALPLDSPHMIDLLNYLQWISKEFEHIKPIPWLGLPNIKSVHQPNSIQGQKDYIQYCAACHKENGQGGGVLGRVEGKTIPPLWGPYSFNDGAGMSTIKKLAPFIHLNMPYQDAALTEEQALDIAAFILQQPRPHFKH